MAEQSLIAGTTRPVFWGLVAVLIFLSHASAQSIDILSEHRVHALAETAQWRALLHLDRAAWFGRLASRIDSEDFFLSSEGGSNPRAELEATIAALLRPEPEERYAGCRYPARLLWMRSVMPELEERLPVVHCTRFIEWRDAIDAESVTVIFPSSYLNNPASAFGHTLLRFEPRQTPGAKLLAYSANFAAETEGDNALVYALRGVFGGYNGYFSVAPFHQKVTQYSDLENRDIFEYRLNLTLSELALLVAHLWELRKIPFQYYYFDDNCSLQILALLEVATPTRSLTERFPLWVIPVDTVRALYESTSFVHGVDFRPSAASKLRSIVNSLSTSELDFALGIGDIPQRVSLETIAPLPPASRAKILDVAIEYQTYLRIRRSIDSDESKRQAWDLLVARSAIPAQGGGALEPLNQGALPESGHETARFGIASGVEDGHPFSELRFRPAFHDLLDPPRGYLPGAGIEFFNTTVRFGESSRISNWGVDLLAIESFTPRERFVDPISWRLKLNVRDRVWNLDDSHILSTARVGVGRAWRFLENGAATLLLEGELLTSAHYRERVSPGAGPTFVFVLPREWGALGFESYFRGSYDSLLSSRSGVQGQVRFFLSDELTLRLSSTSEFERGDSTTTLQAGFDLFFTP